MSEELTRGEKQASLQRGRGERDRDPRFPTRAQGPAIATAPWVDAGNPHSRASHLVPAGPLPAPRAAEAIRPCYSSKQIVLIGAGTAGMGLKITEHNESNCF